MYGLFYISSYETDVSIHLFELPEVKVNYYEASLNRIYGSF
jgi:hypothetical protein